MFLCRDRHIFLAFYYHQHYILDQETGTMKIIHAKLVSKRMSIPGRAVLSPSSAALPCR